MLSASPESIAQSIDFLKQTQFTQAQQQQIETTIGAIAQQQHWPRQRAAEWLSRQAF